MEHIYIPIYKTNYGDYRLYIYHDIATYDHYEIYNSQKIYDDEIYELIINIVRDNLNSNQDSLIYCLIKE